MKISDLRMGEVLVALVMAVLLQGCGAAPDLPVDFPADPGIVAVYDGGVVSLEDVDAAILARPAEERVSREVSSRERLRDVIEDIVLERLLFEAPVDEEELESRLAPQRKEALHRATVAAYLEDRLPDAAPPTDAEIREFFETHGDLRRREGRRLVHNIFLRTGGRSGGMDLESTADEIRRRFAHGESFSVLAREFSDSESRHEGGLVGWLSRDRLSPDLAEVVFGLEENQISEPVVTPQGVHLFLVTDVVEPGMMEFEDLRPQITQRLQLEKREAAIERLVSHLPEIPGAFVARAEDLEALFRRGEATADVLKIGDYRLDVATLRGMVSQRGLAPGKNPGAVAGQLVESIARRERIFSAAQAEGLDGSPEVEEAVEGAMRATELSLRRRLVAERLVDADPEALESWFSENSNRYLTPLRLRISRLIMSFDPATARRTMAALEAFSQTSGVDLEGLEKQAERLGGQVHDEGWMTLSELSAIRPVAAELASQLDAGELSAPYRTETTLQMLLVHQRQAPEAQPFTAVRARVRQDYLAAHGSELYGDWARRALEDCGLRIDLDRMGVTGGD